MYEFEVTADEEGGGHVGNTRARRNVLLFCIGCNSESSKLHVVAIDATSIHLIVVLMKLVWRSVEGITLPSVHYWE
jgi:hypothetical protein